MSYGCKSAVGCVDARMPVRATYVNLYKWPESDAEFVKSVTGSGDQNQRKRGASPRVVDSYSCRQMYLRSYTFSKKESVPEKTRRCLGRVKEKAADFPFIVIHQKKDGRGSTDHGGSSKNYKRKKSYKSKAVTTMKEKKKKGCVAVRKLRDVSYTVICSVFRRLLACSASVDVADRGAP